MVGRFGAELSTLPASSAWPTVSLADEGVLRHRSPLLNALTLMRVRRLLSALSGSVVLLAGCNAAQVRYAPQAASIRPGGDAQAVLYLIGDAGTASPGRDAVLRHLSSDIEQTLSDHPGLPAAAVFLGDNIYEVGARTEYQSEDLAKLVAQVDALGRGRPSLRGVFLPGNHDWARGADYAEARAAIRRQQEWLDVMTDVQVDLRPGEGCAGPDTLDLGVDVHLVFIDTEWLLREPQDDCGGADAFYARLRDDLAANRGRRIILASHHPMESGGPHGGHVAPFENGPLVYFLAVKAGLSIQDISSVQYSSMMDRIRTSIGESGVQPLAFAAGHDHSLQVIGLGGPGEPRYQLVSGSGSKSSPTERIEGTRYATDQHGYMRLEFHSDRTDVVVHAWTEGDPTLRAVFACTLEGGDGCPEAPLATARR